MIRIPNWHPARLNGLMHCHWGTRSRRKRADRQVVSVYAKLCHVPKAKHRRRVDLCLTLGPRQRGGDPDAYLKSLLDGLVACGLLTDDNRQGVELGQVTFTRGSVLATEITLTDLGIEP